MLDDFCLPVKERTVTMVCSLELDLFLVWISVLLSAWWFLLARQGAHCDYGLFLGARLVSCLNICVIKCLIISACPSRSALWLWSVPGSQSGQCLWAPRSGQECCGPEDVPQRYLQHPQDEQRYSMDAGEYYLERERETDRQKETDRERGGGERGGGGEVRGDGESQREWALI